MSLPASDLIVWAIIAVVSVVVFLLRFSFIYLFGRIDTVPPRIQRSLRYVPPAVFAALAAPSILTPEAASPSLALAKPLAAVAGGIVAWYTDDLKYTLVAGMGTLWLLDYLG